MKPGNLGFTLLTHDTREIDALHARLKVFGATIVTPPTAISGDGKPYRMMLAKGPNEEMFEFTDFSPVKKRAAKKKPKAKAKTKRPGKRARR
jgi:hypothetical protein